MTEPTASQSDSKLRSVIDRLEELEAVFDHYGRAIHSEACREAAVSLREGLIEVHEVRVHNA